jgi:hypothetical protein
VQVERTPSPIPTQVQVERAPSPTPTQVESPLKRPLENPDDLPTKKSKHDESVRQSSTFVPPPGPKVYTYEEHKQMLCNALMVEERWTLLKDKELVDIASVVESLLAGQTIMTSKIDAHTTKIPTKGTLEGMHEACITKLLCVPGKIIHDAIKSAKGARVEIKGHGQTLVPQLKKKVDAALNRKDMKWFDLKDGKTGNDQMKYLVCHYILQSCIEENVRDKRLFYDSKKQLSLQGSNKKKDIAFNQTSCGKLKWIDICEAIRKKGWFYDCICKVVQKGMSLLEKKSDEEGSKTATELFDQMNQEQEDEDDDIEIID